MSLTCINVNVPVTISYNQFGCTESDHKGSLSSNTKKTLRNPIIFIHLLDDNSTTEYDTVLNVFK